MRAPRDTPCARRIREAPSADPRLTRRESLERPRAEGGPQPFPTGPLSRLILALLIVWNAWAFMPHQSAEVPLPYSEFVSQIASGNVTAVTIVGSAITGRFAHPLTWPQPRKGRQAGPAAPGAHVKPNTASPSVPPARQGNSAANGKPSSPPKLSDRAGPRLQRSDGRPHRSGGLLAERQSVTLKLLTGARERLDALVEALLKEETLGEEQLGRILGPRPSAEAPPKTGTPAATRVG